MWDDWTYSFEYSFDAMWRISRNFIPKRNKEKGPTGNVWSKKLVFLFLFFFAVLNVFFKLEIL